jgi:hypothetical protein
LKIEKDLFIILSKLHLFFPSLLLPSNLFSFLLSSNSYSNTPHFSSSTLLYFKMNTESITDFSKIGLFIIETLFYSCIYYYIMIFYKI